MGKDTIALKFKDMYAIKHSLQNTVIQKKQEVTFLNKQGKVENKIKIEQLKSDIVHEQNLIEQIIEEIRFFKFKNKIK